MNEETTRKRAAIGREFKRFAEGKDGLFEVFDFVEKDYLQTLVSTDVTETVSREAIYHRVAALRDLRRVIETLIIEGYSAEKMMAALTEKANKKKVRA